MASNIHGKINIILHLCLSHKITIHPTDGNKLRLVYGSASEKNESPTFIVELIYLYWYLPTG